MEIAHQKWWDVLIRIVVLHLLSSLFREASWYLMSRYNLSSCNYTQVNFVSIIVFTPSYFGQQVSLLHTYEPQFSSRSGLIARYQ